MKKLRVILADDHTIVRQGIETLLAGEEDIEIVAQSADGYQLLADIEEQRPDLAIVDISMPRLNGLEATRRIKKGDSEIKVILLSMYDDEEYIRKAIKCGAEGYVLKEDAIEELVEAIRSVVSGYYYLSPSVLNSLVDIMRKGLEKQEPDPYEKLTAREREILQLIAEGYTNKEIAQVISRSVETVRTHRANIMEKLDLHSGDALTKFALERGIVKEEDAQNEI
ncbi:MAG: response regulator transcription factor [Candidatus Bipolaricaulota bacterium]